MTAGGDERQGTAKPTPERTNQAGSTCPPWCTADHAKVQSHMSNPTTSGLPQDPLVRIVQWGGSRYSSEQPTVTVTKIAAFVQLRHSDAKDLADLLEELADDCTPDQLRKLADDIRTAASAIDPIHQLTATTAQMRANREPELE